MTTTIPSPYPLNGGAVTCEVTNLVPTSSTPASVVGQLWYVQNTNTLYICAGYSTSTGFIWQQLYPGQSVPNPPTGALYYNGTAVDGYILNSALQVFGANSSGAPAALSLVAGTGISVVPSGNAVTITNTAIGVVTSFSTVAVNTTMNVSQGYVVTAPANMALPSPSVIGNTVIVIATVAGVKITQNASQQIQYPSSSSASTFTTLGTSGSYTAAVAGASVTLTCINSSNLWIAYSQNGNWIPV